MRLLTDVGLRIHDLRKSRKWSRRELGKRTGLSERFLAEVEGGRGNPSLKSLAGIAEALDTTPAALLSPTPEVIALLGLRGAGKSTVGRLLAERLGRPFVELDARVEEVAGLSLREIFELHGEMYYRRAEREALAEVLTRWPRAILATGGGIVTDPGTFDLLQRSTTTVWLRARPELHWSRVVDQGDHRPMENDPLAMSRLRDLLVERDPLYRQAHHVIDTSDLGVDDVVQAMQSLVSREAS